MAENENDRWIRHATDGVETDFTYDFDVEASTELFLTLALDDGTVRTNDPADASPLVEGVDYTVDTGTKTVSFTTAPADGDLAIEGDTDYSNNFSQTDSQPVNTAALNLVVNRLTRLIQQNWTMNRRSWKVGRQSTQRDVEVPDIAVADAGKILGVDSAGALTLLSSITGVDLTMSSIGEDIATAANAAAVRVLLGLVLGTDIYSKAAVDDAFTRIDGTKAFTGDQSMGSNKLTSLADGSASGDAIHYGQIDPLKTVRVVDDFIGGDQDSTDNILITQMGWRIVTSGTGAAVSIHSGAPESAAHPGLVRLETGTTTTGTAAICGRTEAANLLLSGGAVRFDWVVYIDTLADGTDDYEAYAGLLDHRAIGSADEGVYFYYDRDTSSNWLAVSKADTTASTEDTGVAVATGWVRLTAIANAAGTSIGYYINGTLAATITTNINTDEGMLPVVAIIKEAGTTERTIYVDLFALQIDLTTSR